MTVDAARATVIRTTAPAGANGSASTRGHCGCEPGWGITAGRRAAGPFLTHSAVAVAACACRKFVWGAKTQVVAHNLPICRRDRINAPHRGPGGSAHPQPTATRRSRRLPTDRPLSHWCRRLLRKCRTRGALVGARGRGTEKRRSNHKGSDESLHHPSFPRRPYARTGFEAKSAKIRAGWVRLLQLRVARTTNAESYGVRSLSTSES